MRPTLASRKTPLPPMRAALAMAAMMLVASAAGAQQPSPGNAGNARPASPANLASAIAGFALPADFLLPSDGECMASDVDVETGVRGAGNSLVFLSAFGGQVTRRLRVDFDSLGGVTRYSDIWPTERVEVAADLAGGVGRLRAPLAAGQTGASSWMGSPAELLAAERLGPPLALIALVRERCDVAEPGAGAP
jgi:hypothetical protein